MIFGTLIIKRDDVRITTAVRRLIATGGAGLFESIENRRAAAGAC
jgi:hypothetical protein